ncbi:GNAT family N-acetyltransferase [Primorskyibacter flagellatus]|uniref:Acetyltransferase (GNAT) domain-containing protein n=1 Tax=Primorskyibacter flagellatus TaxID=1387277 RepID=A0A1W1ZNV6_9RHOB|nr:GNAT family N-acetyltransferase [Primorskyibacter flagellatus]SMC49892.1 Acetyltransferase (GNAT) domain-containing protein [Primorskyibacter flagellatus]
MTIILRPARSLDAGKIGGLMSDGNAANAWKPHLHSAAEDISYCAKMIDCGWVTVACEDRLLLGFIARQEDYVHALYVSAQARGSGVGRMLLDDAKIGRNRLKLWTFQHNIAAQRFYLREGFTEDSRTDGHSNEEKLPDIRYIWARKGKT